MSGLWSCMWSRQWRLVTCELVATTRNKGTMWLWRGLWEGKSGWVDVGAQVGGMDLWKPPPPVLPECMYVPVRLTAGRFPARQATDEKPGGFPRTHGPLRLPVCVTNDSICAPPSLVSSSFFTAFLWTVVTAYLLCPCCQPAAFSVPLSHHNFGCFAKMQI